jgi:hypothetical protein
VEGNRTQGHPPKTELTQLTPTLNPVRSYAARPGVQNARNMRYQGTRNCDRNRQYSQSNSRHERCSLSCGSGRQDIQDGATPVPSNDSRRNLNPDANVYAPRISVGEVNLNANEISPVT